MATTTLQERIDTLRRRLEHLEVEAGRLGETAETVALPREAIEREVVAEYKAGRITEDDAQKILGARALQVLCDLDLEEEAEQRYLDKALDGLQILASRVLVETCHDYKTAALELARRFEALDDAMTSGKVPTQWRRGPLEKR